MIITSNTTNTTTGMSIFYGKIHYPHMNLYFESLRINTGVHYELINVVNNDDDKIDIIKTVQHFNLSNFHITFITTPGNNIIIIAIISIILTCIIIIYIIIIIVIIIAIT